MLFEADDASEAQEMLNSLLAGDVAERCYSCANDDPERVRPRLMYLLGLAYELSGDELNAVKTYWQLWHDYLDNPYTLMARRKLEPIAP